MTEVIDDTKDITIGASGDETPEEKSSLPILLIGAAVVIYFMMR